MQNQRLFKISCLERKGGQRCWATVQVLGIYTGNGSRAYSGANSGRSQVSDRVVVGKNVHCKHCAEGHVAGGSEGSEGSVAGCQHCHLGASLHDVMQAVPQACTLSRKLDHIGSTKSPRCSKN